MNIATRFLDDALARGYADRPALYFGDEVHTYQDLCQMSWRVSAALRAVGVQPEQRVLLIAKDSPLFIAAWFATLRIGAVTSEAYTYLPVKEIRAYVAALRPAALVADETTIGQVRSAIEGLPYPRTVLVSGVPKSTLRVRERALDPMLKTKPAECDPEPTTANQAAYCLFSGGTTGEVKVVVHRHLAAEVMFTGIQDLVGYDEDDLVLPVPKLFFGYARLYGPVSALRAGAASVIYPQRASATRILELTRKHRPTVLVNVPTMMRKLLDLRGAKREDFTSVRLMTSSGEHLGPDLYLRWLESFGVEVVNFLSSTELGAVPCLANGPGEQVPGSVGKPRPGVDAKLVDPETGEESGEAGILMLRTEGSGVSYWENYEKSWRTFRGDGWVSHNDLFRRDKGGNYWFAGRSDDLVKVSGTFISPTEIETCLDGHSDVVESAVVAAEDRDGLMTTVAFVAVRERLEGTSGLDKKLQDYVKGELAPTKYPRTVRFLPKLPKTPQGKINRRRLNILTKEALK